MRYPWQTTIQHEQLHTYRVIRGLTREEVEQKAAMQLQAWNERWRKISAAQSARDQYSDLKGRASLLTREAESKLEEARGILIESLRRSKPFDWGQLKD